jgi:hypothetical protein
MNIIITAPHHTDISFATMNRIRDIVMRVDDNFQQIFTTYEVADNFDPLKVKNMPKQWLIDKIKEDRFDMLIVVGYSRPMSIIDAAEEQGIDVILFKEK